MRRGPKPAKSTEAKPPVARKSSKNEDSRVSDLEKRLAEALSREAEASKRETEALGRLQTRDRELTEALEQQTATSEILRVIGSSPSDLQPVFDIIAKRATALTDAVYSAVYRIQDGSIHLRAYYSDDITNTRQFAAAFPMPITSETLIARTLRTGTLAHIADMEDVSVPEAGRTLARTLGVRSTLAVPMQRDGHPIGAIGVNRREPGDFTPAEIALLQTFADQAVIAIENVRLFRELQARNRDLTEALDRQTATADVLRIIAQSPTELQPVLDAIAASAVRLCAASDAVIERLEGDRFYNAAHAGTQMKGLVGLPLPLTRRFPGGRAVLDRQRVIIDDIHVVAEREYPDTLELLKLNTIHSVAEIPLLSEGNPLGTIAVLRAEVRPFTGAEVALLETFADQAVIAIENVRLFKELQQKNEAVTLAHAQVTETLEQQTATSEILRVIASSPTDLQPVLDVLVESAGRLCEAADTFLLLVEGDQLRVAALHPSVEGGVISNPIQRGWVAGRAVMELRTVHVQDLANAQSEFPLGWEIAVRLGHRTALAMPLLRKGVPIGALFLRRREVRLFSDKEIALLQTFAAQAVIAIENVRLFKELETRNQQITDALEREKASGAVLRIVSEAGGDATPVFEAILANAVRLCDAGLGQLFLWNGEALMGVASHGARAETDAIVRGNVFRVPAAMLRARPPWRPLQVPDMRETEGYRAGWNVWSDVEGIRSFLTVPLAKADRYLGCIMVYRREIRAFSDAQVDLLRTFADQAVIALENARVLTELQDKNRALTKAHAQVTEALEQQTATSEILRVISSSPTDIQPVLDAIARNAVTLCGGIRALVLRFDGVMLHVAGHHNIDPHGVEQIRRAFPHRPGRDTPVGRAFLDRSVVHVPDLQAAASEFAASTARQRGVGSMLAVPLLREQEAVGVIGLAREVVGPFSPEQIEVLQTFADQAVIAIENVRLFKELEVANRELSAASQHKSEFLANMSHELRTPLNAIIGFSEVLTDRMFGELNEKQEEYLKDIYASGTHLLSLINDILDLSKIEAGRMELELTDFDLPTALDNALTLVRERAGRRGITLQATVDGRLGEVRADERKIRQVTLNLLSNAIKFTPEGGRIEVRAVPADGSVEVSVSDTGVGIAPEDQEAVFEEFRQVGTSAAKQEGTGLGLALCRKFVELHGGKIRVQSEVGRGSTFTFTIPVRRGE